MGGERMERGVKREVVKVGKKVGIEGLGKGKVGMNMVGEGYGGCVGEEVVGEVMRGKLIEGMIKEKMNGGGGGR